jgi:O-antigen ligase
MVWSFVLSAGILSFFAVFVFKLEPSFGDYSRLAELYTYDSNDLGVLLMIGLPLTLLLLIVDRGIKRWLLAANLILISAAMARSGSRGGFLGLVAVAIAGLVLVNGVSVAKRTSVLIVAMIALAFAAPPGYWKQMGTILAPKADYNYSSVDGRTALIKRGLGYMAGRPNFGIGIWNFAKAECTISPKIEDPSIGVKCIAPHNSVIQAAAELGVPGLIAWPSLLIGLLIGPLRLRRKLPPAWRRSTNDLRFLYASTTFFPIAMCGFAVTSFFVTFAFADPIYLMAGLTTGLYAVVRAQLAAESGATPVAAVASRRGRFEGWRVKRSEQRLIPAGHPGGGA